MLPLLPHTMFIRDKEFVKEEWEQYFAGGQADTAEGGWRGVLWGNYATIDPKGAWQVFAGAGVPSGGIGDGTTTGGSQPADPTPGFGNGNGTEPVPAPPASTGTLLPTSTPTVLPPTTTSAVSTPGFSTAPSTPTVVPTSTSVPTTPVPSVPVPSGVPDGVPDGGAVPVNNNGTMMSKMARRTIRRALEKGKMKIPVPAAAVRAASVPVPAPVPPKGKRGGFSAENLDGGASLTWYLTWCAGKSLDLPFLGDWVNGMIANLMMIALGGL